jgi:excinuclease ABC subunit C
MKGSDRAGQVQARLAALPEAPGVYLMKDAKDRIIYIGKAILLKNRVRSYFQESKGMAARTRMMVSKICEIDWIVTDSEMEALVLECSLIKQHRPYFNIRLKDDKSYPYLKITLGEEWPRMFLTRTLVRDGSRYFGPYTNVTEVRQLMRTLEKVFPLRKCPGETPREKGRGCLNRQIGLCLGPCLGGVEADQYRDLVNEVIMFFEGRSDTLLHHLKEAMEKAAAVFAFEEAARCRDQLHAVTQVVARQKVLREGGGDMDAIAWARSADETSVTIFIIRGGRLVRQENLWLTASEGYPDEQLAGETIKQFYGEGVQVPSEILLLHPPDDHALLTEWLADLRGGKTELHVPQRGLKRDIVRMAEKNAAEILRRETLRLQMETTQVAEALQSLAKHLALPEEPRRIECFDISNIQGSEPVASMVVFTDGRKDTSSYRRFKIRGIQGPDDFAMMAQVLRRRWQNQFERGDAFAVTPQLLVVDGGQGQVSAAAAVLREVGQEAVALIGLAKKNEEIWCSGASEPLCLPQDDPGLYLLQRVRDEAHRFAITYHRKLRDNRTLHSRLDDVKGVGPAKRTLLLRTFGSIETMSRLTPEEIAAVPGITIEIAEEIKAALNFELPDRV